jgi:hypothetical protein
VIFADFMKSVEADSESSVLVRNPKETEYYRHLSDEGSYYIYCHTLHQFSLAVLLTLDTHDSSSYSFPLTEDDRSRGRTLIEKLKSKESCLSTFHSFILPLLYARDLQASENDYSKWNEPLEGFMALHNLQEDGNFKPPHQVTQLFAHLHYHIRGTMLYEGDRTVKDFGNNIYKLGRLFS